MFGRGLNMRAAIVRYNLCAAMACHGLCDIVVIRCAKNQRAVIAVLQSFAIGCVTMFVI